MSPSEVPTTTPGPVHLYFSVFQTKSRILNLASQVALVVKNLLANAGAIRDLGLIPGSGRSPEEVNGNSLQFSCLENFTEIGAWWGHRESNMIKHAPPPHTHTRIWLGLPWLLCQCRRHRFDPWRRKRHPIPVFFPGKPHGQRSLAVYSSWGYKELDRT